MRLRNDIPIIEMMIDEVFVQQQMMDKILAYLEEKPDALYPYLIMHMDPDTKVMKGGIELVGRFFDKLKFDDAKYELEIWPDEKTEIDYLAVTFALQSKENLEKIFELSDNMTDIRNPQKLELYLKSLFMKAFLQILKDKNSEKVQDWDLFWKKIQTACELSNDQITGLKNLSINSFCTWLTGGIVTRIYTICKLMDGKKINFSEAYDMSDKMIEEKIKRDQELETDKLEKKRVMETALGTKFLEQINKTSMLNELIEYFNSVITEDDSSLPENIRIDFENVAIQMDDKTIPFKILDSNLQQTSSFQSGFETGCNELYLHFNENFRTRKARASLSRILRYGLADYIEPKYIESSLQVLTRLVENQFKLRELNPLYNIDTPQPATLTTTTTTTTTTTPPGSDTSPGSSGKSSKKSKSFADYAGSFLKRDKSDKDKDKGKDRKKDKKSKKP